MSDITETRLDILPPLMLKLAKMCPVQHETPRKLLL